MILKDILGFMRDGNNWFLKALFPPKCFVCRKEGAYLCFRHKQFESAPMNEVSFRFVEEVFAAVKYWEPMAEKAIELFKFRGFMDIAEIMAQEMIERAPENFFKEVLLVPVPLHWTRRFWRGFNQAERLAQKIAEKHPSIEIFRGLKRVRSTYQQAKLNKKERAKNLEKAFILEAPLVQNKKILLIDDVVATGKTLEAAAQTLKKGGAGRVYAAVFARGGH